MIDDVDFPRHGEIFDGDNRELFLSDLVQARAFRQNGYAEIVDDQIFDRGDIVHFDRHVEGIQILVVALQMRLEERARSRIRKPQNQFFLFQFFQRDHAPAGKGVFVADRKHQIVGIQQDAVEIIVENRALAELTPLAVLSTAVILIFAFLPSNSLIILPADELSVASAFCAVAKAFISPDASPVMLTDKLAASAITIPPLRKTFSNVRYRNPLYLHSIRQAF